jgi:hypothetical protein
MMTVCLVLEIWKLTTARQNKQQEDLVSLPEVSGKNQPIYNVTGWLTMTGRKCYQGVFEKAVVIHHKNVSTLLANDVIPCKLKLPNSNSCS